MSAFLKAAALTIDFNDVENGDELTLLTDDLADAATPGRILILVDADRNMALAAVRDVNEQQGLMTVVIDWKSWAPAADGGHLGEGLLSITYHGAALIPDFWMREVSHRPITFRHRSLAAQEREATYRRAQQRTFRPLESVSEISYLPMARPSGPVLITTRSRGDWSGFISVLGVSDDDESNVVEPTSDELHIT